MMMFLMKMYTTRVSKNIAFIYVYNSNAQFSETSTPSPNRKCESRVDSE